MWVVSGCVVLGFDFAKGAFRGKIKKSLENKKSLKSF